MGGGRRLTPGERRHGFVMPIPHTRSARKSLQMYLKALRPHAHDVAAMLKVPDEIMQPGRSPQEIGAAYLSAFMDELSVRLLNES
jgi:hypothetical protein